MKKDKALTGAAGEYYVAFRLTAEGYAVGLTPRRTSSIDLIVANPNIGKSITIQTKTMGIARGTASWWKWRVGKSRQSPHGTFFYAFVDLKSDPSQTPDVFIVPSGELAFFLEVYPAMAEGKEIKDVWCVIYNEDASKYQNRWDIIKDALTA